MYGDRDASGPEGKSPSTQAQPAVARQAAAEMQHCGAAQPGSRSRGLSAPVIVALQRSAGNASVTTYLQESRRAPDGMSATASSAGDVDHRLAGSRPAAAGTLQAKAKAKARTSAASPAAKPASEQAGRGSLLATVIKVLTSIATWLLGHVPGLRSKARKALQVATRFLAGILAPFAAMRTRKAARGRKLVTSVAREERHMRAVVDEAAKPQATGESVPGPLGEVDRVADGLESAGDDVLGAGHKILEGALVGDYEDDPDAWHVLGQVGMGFVPIAGQAADVRVWRPTPRS